MASVHLIKFKDGNMARIGRLRGQMTVRIDRFGWPLPRLLSTIEDGTNALVWDFANPAASRIPTPAARSAYVVLYRKVKESTLPNDDEPLFARGAEYEVCRIARYTGDGDDLPHGTALVDLGPDPDGMLGGALAVHDGERSALRVLRKWGVGFPPESILHADPFGAGIAEYVPLCKCGRLLQPTDIGDPGYPEAFQCGLADVQPDHDTWTPGEST
jgi:hypothetical protein